MRGIDRSQLRRRLADAMRDVGGASGALVFDLDANGDGALYGNDADERRVPASNEKLFTTAAFLSELGPKAHLQTRAYARGKLPGRPRGDARRRPRASSATATRRSAPRASPAPPTSR